MSKLQIVTNIHQQTCYKLISWLHISFPPSHAISHFKMRKCKKRSSRTWIKYIQNKMIHTCSFIKLAKKSPTSVMNTPLAKSHRLVMKAYIGNEFHTVPVGKTACLALLSSEVAADTWHSFATFTSSYVWASWKRVRAKSRKRWQKQSQGLLGLLFQAW